jgi:hypothetical protein
LGKRAEQSIQTIRDQGELPPETADALQELVDVIRAVEGRLSALEGQWNARPTETMALPNRKRTADQLSGVVAAQQLNFCSFSGTAHFHLRQARRVLSSGHRGWADFITVNFRTRKPQCANACGFFNGGYAQRNGPSAGKRRLLIGPAL